MAVFIYGRRTHSRSASAFSIVPNRIWKSLSSKRGPTSSKVTSLWSDLNVWCRKDMKSSWLMKLIHLLESSLGTGNICFKMVWVLKPIREEKWEKTRCGYASDILVSRKLGISWRKTTFEREKNAVGPWGKWEMIKPSGTPLCSWSIMRSVISFDLQAAVISEITWFPRLILWELGTISFSSLANCRRRELGSLDVVIRILGSTTPADAYSSSKFKESDTMRII